MTLSKVKWPPTRGSKGHELNHLVYNVCFRFSNETEVERLIA